MTTFVSKSIFIGVALALGACAADHTNLGSVSMPVTTVGSDGATYSLPIDSRLQFMNDTAIASYDVSLDASAASVSFTAEAGTYHAQIYNLDATYTTMWPLTRTAVDGTTSTVQATLVTAQPMAATVVQGQTTSLLFQFAIATGGTVTFGNGTVDVTIGVGQTAATSFTIAESGSGDVSGTPSFSGMYATDLAAVLPAAGATGLTVSVSAALSGPWQQAGGSIDAGGNNLSVCAPITVTMTTGTGTQGFADLMAEAGHGSAPGFLFGPASLCITDFGTSEEVRIRMSRVGTAETTTYTTIFGAQSQLFWNVLRGTLPTRVYDSTNSTLDLDALAAVTTLPMRVTNRIGTSDFSQFWYVGSVTGQMSFSFVGSP